jgi:GNAT superfamily N-acetyltransferase
MYPASMTDSLDPDTRAAAFADPVWNALHSSHAHLAETCGLAVRYLAAVAPFAAVAELTPAALRDLHSLLAPGETIYTVGPQPPAIEGLEYGGVLPCYQMIYPEDLALPDAKPFEIEPLDCYHGPEMVALTDVAFPGLFRISTCKMGSYYGIRVGDQLVAMAGERFVMDPIREISAVCTHPDHRGKGYAAALMRRVMEDHRRDGNISVLHVVTTNPAYNLYLNLGFQTLRRVDVHRLKSSGMS